MRDFENASVLITGAASGIGAAIATRLSHGGAKKLILIDVNEDALRDFAFSLPSERQLLIGDVADPQLWESADLTGITHAVVNAGIAAGGEIDVLDFAEWRRVMAVNLDGAFLTLQAALRALKSAGAGGAIALTASVAGLKPEPGVGAYGASKAAVIQLMRIAAKEAAAHRIRVNAIAPGGVETPIWRSLPGFSEMADAKGEAAAFQAMADMATPLGRFATAEEIAEQVAFLLSDKSAYITGTVLVSDGGYSL